MSGQFSVTYERITPESAAHGDADERGFVIQDVGLREAIQSGFEIPHPDWCGALDPSDSDIERARWLTWLEWNGGTRDAIETGTAENRSLHIPDHVTGSTRRRIARMLAPNDPRFASEVSRNPAP